MFFYIGLLVLCTLCWLFYKYIIGSYDYWKTRGIHYIEPTFPFGNISALVRMQKSYGDFLAHLYNSTTADFVGFWIFNIPHLLIRSPELVKNILVKDFHQFSDRAVSGNKNDPIFNNMLFSMNFHDWKVIRNKLSPAFTAAKLKHMMYIFNESADDLVDHLDGFSGIAVDCKDLTSKFTANAFTACGFGYKINCFKDANCNFFKYAKKVIEATFVNVLKFLSAFLIPKLIDIMQFQLVNKEATQFFRYQLMKILREREASGAKHDDFVDTYIQLKNEGNLGDGITLDDDKLLAQAIQFYIAGFETTSSIIAFALYELAVNEAIQDKLRLEVLEALQDEEHETFSYETIRNLSYLNKVISESLRKYPTLPLIDRKCIEDYKVPGTDIVIEAGTKCQISPLGLHYDPEYYPNPETFDPERFSPEGIQSRPGYVYVPFGDGPHNCVGKRIGLLTAKICVAKILTKFNIELSGDTPKPMGIDSQVFLLTPKNMFLRFTKI